ncbi:CBS domain-containing protein [Sedimentibacter sp. MB31-C6]|uniref:CBS domain-containing protein n=1 Tax=Sedimentibacter sp. MB31-C6 TaxID=3109366 RepID=UPI002DDDB312|nr:CBS domain-containing protein [Sedimentibacter sp. MB36-C1]WSI04025.1 CBS domain-containing protein [Sedimentibacter sp. MB36-C1]
MALNTVVIHANNIYKTSLNSNALEVIQEMNKNTYTHVLVLEDGKIIGVFSENTVFSFFAHKEDVILEKEALIREFLTLFHLINMRANILNLYLKIHC